MPQFNGQKPIDVSSEHGDSIPSLCPEAVLSFKAENGGVTYVNGSFFVNRGTGIITFFPFVSNVCEPGNMVCAPDVLQGVDAP